MGEVFARTFAAPKSLPALTHVPIWTTRDEQMAELTEEEGEPKHAHTMQHERLDVNVAVNL